MKRIALFIPCKIDDLTVSQRMQYQWIRNAIRESGAKIVYESEHAPQPAEAKGIDLGVLVFSHLPMLRISRQLRAMNIPYNFVPFAVNPAGHFHACAVHNTLGALIGKVNFEFNHLKTEPLTTDQVVTEPSLMYLFGAQPMPMGNVNVEIAEHAQSVFYFKVPDATTYIPDLAQAGEPNFSFPMCSGEIIGYPSIEADYNKETKLIERLKNEGIEYGSYNLIAVDGFPEENLPASAFAAPADEPLVLFCDKWGGDALSLAVTILVTSRKAPTLVICPNRLSFGETSNPNKYLRMISDFRYQTFTSIVKVVEDFVGGCKSLISLTGNPDVLSAWELVALAMRKPLIRTQKCEDAIQLKKHVVDAANWEAENNLLVKGYPMTTICDEPVSVGAALTNASNA